MLPQSRLFVTPLSKEACEVTNERFEEEYPYTLDHASYSCASTDCMGRLIREGKTCYTFDGGIINPSASAPQDSRETRRDRCAAWRV